MWFNPRLCVMSGSSVRVAERSPALMRSRLRSRRLSSKTGQVPCVFSGRIWSSGGHGLRWKWQFELGPNHEVMGSPLRILLPPSCKVGDQLRVQIFYSTTKDCTAVQWLGKE